MESGPWMISARPDPCRVGACEDGTITVVGLPHRATHLPDEPLAIQRRIYLSIRAGHPVARCIRVITEKELLGRLETLLG